MGTETAELLGFSVTAWIVNIVGFLVLLAMLRAWLWRPIRSVIEKRAERIAKQLQEAEERLAEAEILRKEARDYRAAQEAEALRQREAILRQAEEEAERLRQRAREEAREIRRRGEQAAEEMRVKALDEAKTQLAKIAGAMAGKLLYAVLDEERHSAVLEAALSDLQQLVEQQGGS
jgi:F-type H+-transporting ATPase subunit b